MSSNPRIGLVDGNAGFCELLSAALAARRIDVEVFRTPSAATRGLEETPGRFHAVACNLGFPDTAGEAFVESILARWPRLPVLVMVEDDSLPNAVECVKRGAQGILVKPFSPEEVVRQLRQTPRVGTRAIHELAGAARKDLQGVQFCGLVGRHPRMLDLFSTIDNVARLRSRTSIFIAGESGTGKELVARAIHELTAPPGEPFIGINCGAFSRSLLDDQLFGHVRGAFTGATDDKPGVFVAARDGTLFLDEITEMAPALQAKFLRAIQEREVFPLGSDRPVPWTARLIVATNRRIEEEVERGLFRRDLFYRIHVIRLDIPALRERLEDVPVLARHFLAEFVARSGQDRILSEEAVDALCAYAYPGNVRELRNIIESAWALSRGGRIEISDLPADLRQGNRLAFPSLSVNERDHVVRALRLSGGSKVKAARFLQIDRNRLYRMIRKHGIRADEF